MAQEKLVRAVYPEGTHLDVSRTTSGALRGTVRDDETNELVGHAELHEVDDFGHEYQFDGDSDAESDSEIGLAGVLAGLAIVGLSLGAIAVAGSVRDRKARRRDEKRMALDVAQITAPPAGWYDVDAGTQRWWDGVKWTDHFRANPHHASAPAGWYNDGTGRQRWWDGFAWTHPFHSAEVIAEAAHYPVHGVTTQTWQSNAVIPADMPRLTMSTAEWQERVRAMLLARAISEQQWRLLSVARIEDANSELLEWQQQLASLTPQQFADQLNLAVQAAPVAALAVAHQAVAGWYEDGSGQQRWWDGLHWTEHLLPQALPVRAGEAPVAQPGWYDDGSGRQRLWDGQHWR